MTTFDRHTAVVTRDADEYEATIDPSWNVLRGPNGGYVAAILLRAFTERVGDERRFPRTLSIQYVAPPPPGPVTITTRLERAGRSVAMLTARMTVDDRVLANAFAVFSSAWEAEEYQDVVMPEVKPPEGLPVLRFPAGQGPAFFPHYERRLAIGGAPFSGGDRSLSGGWIRLAERRTPDPPFLAAAADAWPPSIFTRTKERLLGLTTDLTIHFRSSRIGLGPGDFVLGEFVSTVCSEGFYEEDGRLWSADGRLLVQSRQLALGAPVPSV